MTEAHLQRLVSFRPARRLDLSEVGTFWGRAAPGELRVAGPDEDAVTLATAAASRLPRDVVAECSTVILARAHVPEGSGDGAAVIAVALGLDRSIRTFEIAGSDRCFLTALEMAAALVRASMDRAVLVVAGDDTRARPGSPAERGHGHGAAAAVVSATPGAAEILESTASVLPAPDRWFSTDRSREDAGERFIASTLVPEALGSLDFGQSADAARVDHVVVALPDRRASIRIAASLGPADSVGDSAWKDGAPGSTLPAALLVDVLSSVAAGEIVDMIAFGSGASRLRFRAGDASAVSAVVETAGPTVPYATYLRAASLLEPGLSAPSASPVTAARDLPSTLGLTGASCSDCGATYFPTRPSCTICGGETHSGMTRLTGDAVVVTTTTDHLVAGVNPGTPESPTTMVVAETESGARVFLPAVHGLSPRVGDRVRPVLRLAHRGGGFRNYHWRFDAAEDDG